jgi:large subunit ribosomal protein L29
MHKAKDLRDMAIEELEATFTETRKELFQLHNEMQQTKKIEKPHLLRQKRKEIARMLTVMTEKQAMKQKS